MTWRCGAASRRKQESLCAQIAEHNALKRAVRSWVQRSVTVWSDLKDETASLVRERRVKSTWSEWRKAAAQRCCSRAKDNVLERSLQAVSKAVDFSRKLFHWKVWLTHCHTVRTGEKVMSLRRKGMLTRGFSAWALVTDIRSRGHHVRRMQDVNRCSDSFHTWTRKVS
jgi:hypothetical protein